MKTKTLTRLSPFAALLFALLPPSIRAQRAPSAPFSQTKIQSDIAYLSSDALGGRGSGTEGNALAATFIALEFRRFGLRPMGTLNQNDPNAPLEGKGYYQPFEFNAGRLVGSGSTLSVTSKSGSSALALTGDFALSPLSAAGKAENAEVVFAGYGVSAPSAGRDDYAGIDVSRKVVILLPGVTKGYERFGELRAKVLSARDKGAVAVITVGTESESAGSRSSFENTSDSGIPVFILQEKALDALFVSGGKSLATLRENTKKGNAIADLLDLKITFNADVKKIQKRTQNVVGFLEGTDYNLREQVVVIGAHMDHLGLGGTGSLDTSGKPAIHPGADDNASGTTGVLMLAEYYAKHRPKRSLLFMCFSGEELGLLGSAHYVREPIIALSNTVAMVNLDMIGRLKNEALIVGGSGTAHEFAGLLTEAETGQNTTLKVSRSETGFGASDHQSFYTHGTPVLFFFTGTHEDYHKPSDTANKINAGGEAEVLNFVRSTVTKIANAPFRPTFVQVSTPANTGGARSFRVYLGTVPNYSVEGVRGVLLDGVREGSPAATAGLKVGDIITRMNNLTINSLQDYVTALQQLNPGESVAIIVRRGAETLTFNATVTERMNP